MTKTNTHSNRIGVIALTLLIVALGCGCGTETDHGDGTDVCLAVTCGGHGTCAAVAGSAACTCDTDYHAEGPSCSADELAIIGVFADAFDTDHTVTDSTWTMVSIFGTSVFHIMTYANSQTYLVAQNDSANTYNPDLWSRFDWTTAGSDLWFCQTVYDAASEQAALDATPADDSDPSASGCGGFPWSQLLEPLAIRGQYTDDFATDHTVTQSDWTSSSTYGASLYTITAYDNTAHYLVAQNDSTNTYSPDRWSRFDWTTVGTDLWFCQTVYDAASEQAALDATPADDSDPSASGCGGFPWSQLLEPLAIRGLYTDDFATDHTVTQSDWTSVSTYGTSVYNITTYDNTTKHLVAQNDSANTYNPDLWSRFDWTTVGTDLWFCQTVYDAASEQAALDATPADDSDPSASGCGGYAWSKLTPAS